MENKHAYLIMAHGDYRCLCSLLASIDHISHDVYIHIDKKWKDFDENNLRCVVKESNMYYIKRRSISWGGDTLLRCELELLQAACDNRQYEYYHLLSGQDMPIKSNAERLDFFDKNPKKQFIDISGKIEGSYKGGLLCRERVEFYWLFQNFIGRDSIFIAKVIRRLQKAFVEAQQRLGYRRNSSIEFYKGGEWFSITDELARYILVRKKVIRRQYRFALCADEIFIQTVVMSSPFKENIEKCKRLIDWNRGAPYVFRSDDKERLLTSNDLFARKFDSRIDDDIIRFLYDLFSV